MLPALLLAVLQDDRAPVEIEFALQREPALQVQVTIDAPGSSSGQTTFEVSEDWGGVSAGGADLVPIGASGRGARPLALETPEPYRWSVRHDPDEALRLRYAIPANDHQDSGEAGTYRRPIVNPGLFHTVGYLTLFLPSQLAGEPERPVRFHWRGFAEAGWSAVCSFGVPEDGELAVSTPLDQVRMALYAAGPLRLLRRDVHGSPLLLSVSGDRWGFRDEQLLDLATAVVTAERTFFQDFDHPFYWISLIPAGPELSSGSANMSGTGLSHCFSLVLNPNATLQGGGPMSMAALLAHEMFHEWNGIRIQREAPEELAYWFSEGFTSFYARRLLLRAGLSSVQGFADSANAAIRSYLTNPARNASNARIQAEFWSNPDVQKAPYERGDVAAMLLDRAIRRASGGKDSLDGLMRELFAEARDQGRRVSTESLLVRFSERAGADTAELLRRVLVDGETAPIPDDLFAPCLESEDATVYAFDLGFDLERSMQEKTVCGVRAGSAAAAAGMKDGQALLGCSVYYGDADRNVEFHVRADGKEQPVAYLPRGAAFEVRRFLVRAGAGAGDCDGL